MALIIKDRIKEVTTTTGQGTITLAGASTGFRSFADIGNANTTYYCISNNNEFEVGVGTYTASGTTLSRDTVLSNSLGTTAKINFSAGSKDVFCTYPSGVAVTNNNPTDITVNGAKVGRGGGNLSSNLAFGTTSLNSPFIISDNTNLVAIGNNTLPLVGKGVATLNLLSEGLDYYDVSGETNTFNAIATLTYLSGTPVMSGGTYPVVNVDVIEGVVSSFTITSSGSGFPLDTSSVTYFTLDLGLNYTSTENAQFNAITYASGNNLIAIGNNAGSNSKTNNNSIYIGNSVTGVADNEIRIGNLSNLNTYISGNLTTNGVAIGSGTLSAGGTINLSGSAANPVSLGTNVSTGTITIGRSGGAATGTITLGQSTASQTVNIGGTGNIINVGAALGTGTLTFGRSTQAQTVNIATGANSSSVTKAVNIGTNGASGSTTNIAVGSTAGTSTTTVNGLLKLQTYLVANLPTGSAGAKSFVTNALAPTFGAAVAGGGAVGVPVYHDGTSWKVG
jgi:hypothetical protein